MEEYQKMLRSIWTMLLHSLQEKDRLLEENKKLKEEIVKLCAREHKHKEVLPMLEREFLSRLNHREQNPELLRYIRQLHQEQMELESSQELRERVLPSTGYLPLDFQLDSYLREAKEKEIDFNIAVCDKIDDLIEEKIIKGMELLTLMGNFIRNAIYAVMEREKEDRKIFISFGYRKKDHIYNIDIYDNGVEFPAEILAHLGERGNSTRNSGNGYAENIEILKRIGASLKIETRNEKECSFTKQISLSFRGGYFLDLPDKKESVDLQTEKK